MMKQVLFRRLLVILFSACMPAAFAANEGTAVGVDPDAVARISAVERILEVGADVSVGEVIATGPSGLVQIVFDDDTRLVVGPHSALLIEDYLMAGSNSAQKFTIDALGGSFRFITGNSPKPAYSITTPTAAIAVRGTEFDLVVLPGATRVMLYEGALQLCAAAGQCQALTQRCEVATASRQSAELFVRDDPARIPLSLEFRYARFQSPLLPPFRVSGAALCAEDSAIEALEENSGDDNEQPRPRVTRQTPTFTPSAVPSLTSPIRGPN